MTSEVTLDTAINQQRQTNATLGKLADDFTQFLTLLTTQLQNQDPLKPMDTHQFTSQLVQFSQVEQQINSNKKLDTLVQSQISNAFSMSLGYVGLDVNYVSGEFNYDGQNPADIRYALNEEAMESRLFIVDENGKVVHSEEARTAPGAHQFTWDGTTTGGKPVDPGTYSIRVDAVNREGEKIDATTVVSGRVDGVETQNGQIYLVVGERAVPLSSIMKASEPPQMPGDEEAAGGDPSSGQTEEEEAV